MDQIVTPQIPAMGFHFRSSDHTYWLDERLIPGCTTVIMDALQIDLTKIPPDKLEKARIRGENVHLAAMYYDQDRLDWSSVDPDHLSRVHAWVDFREKEGFVPDLVYLESPIYHKHFQYGVTPDRFGLLNGYPAVVEIKNTYTNAWYWRMQTAAQAHALASQGVDINPETVLRFAVNLKPDGTYVLEQHEDPADFSDFMSCLKVYGLKREKK